LFYVSFAGLGLGLGLVTDGIEYNTVDHIKNPMTHCTQLLQQRKAVAAKCCTLSAVCQ